ncbi:MAG: type II 3-dehydroquinate dehydratase [Alphaproteobacteria bacterium]|nr:type II 3-dehydroquinate dehydratase [Alphaproteobacteria bacterium]
MKKILIINGPNLNMLGKRDPKQYGSMTLSDIEQLCRVTAEEYGFEIDFRQSNYEGEIVEWIQKALGQFDALIINGAAYTHTSLAIRDALELLKVPIIEVHLSQPKEREEFRHFSYIERLATETISGHKEQSYVMALKKLNDIIN